MLFGLNVYLNIKITTYPLWQSVSIIFDIHIFLIYFSVLICFLFSKQKRIFYYILLNSNIDKNNTFLLLLPIQTICRYLCTDSPSQKICCQYVLLLCSLALCSGKDPTALRGDHQMLMPVLYNYIHDFCTNSQL